MHLAKIWLCGLALAICASAPAAADPVKVGVVLTFSGNGAELGTVKEIPGVRTYVAVDGGISDNLRPMLYGSRYEALIADRATAEPDTLATIAGMHCESGDVLTPDLDRCSTLANEPLDDLLVRTRRRGEELDRHALVERDVQRRHHDAHPAHAEHPLHAVLAREDFTFLNWGHERRTPSTSVGLG